MIRWLPMLMPYGLLGSIAAWRAIAEIFYAPFHWHKTHHTGLRQPQSQPQP